jgi:hypothetical protein
LPEGPKARRRDAQRAGQVFEHAWQDRAVPFLHATSEADRPEVADLNGARRFGN